MTKKETLYKELEKVPESLVGELLDFIGFLKTKLIKEKMETMIQSESSLQKDWLLPEEDEAWKDL